MEISICYIREDLLSLPKDSAPSELIRANLAQILNDFRCTKILFTEGSKTDSSVGCSFFADGIQALHALEIDPTSSSAAIISDSLNALRGMRNRNSLDPITQKCLSSPKSLRDAGKRLEFI
nr:unnamed protein product [Callosobruchus chinensis]